MKDRLLFSYSRNARLWIWIEWFVIVTLFVGIVLSSVYLSFPQPVGESAQSSYFYLTLFISLTAGFLFATFSIGTCNSIFMWLLFSVDIDDSQKRISILKKLKKEKDDFNEKKFIDLATYMSRRQKLKNELEDVEEKIENFSYEAKTKHDKKIISLYKILKKVD